MSVDVLDKKTFDQCPVWKWDAGHDGYEPVKNYDPNVAYSSDLFIRSKFQLPTGETVGGYLVGAFYKNIKYFHAFGFFVNEQYCGFNFNLYGRALKSLNLLRLHFDLPALNVFPLKYKLDLTVDTEFLKGGVIDPVFNDIGSNLSPVSRLQTVLDGLVKDEAELSYFREQLVLNTKSKN